MHTGEGPEVRVDLKMRGVGSKITPSTFQSHVLVAPRLGESMARC